MDYLKIIKRAAEVTWKHKSTWLFGILYAIFQGRGGFNYTFDSSDFGSRGFPESPSEIADALLSPVVIVSAILLVLIMIVFSIFVGFLAKGALIGMIKDVEMDGQTSINRGFRWGWRNWLWLFGINLTIYVPFAGLALVVSLVLLAPAITSFVFEEIVLGIVLLILAVFLILMLFVPTAIALSLVATLSDRFRVIEQLRVFASIEKGYQALRSNLGTVLLFWLIMVLIGIVLGIIFLPIALILLAPAAALLFMDRLLPAIALGAPGTIILIFLSGLIQTFSSAAWTEFFFELTRDMSGGPEPMTAST